MTTDFKRGWIVGKMLRRSRYPYPAVFKGFHGDQTEFVRGMRFAGCGIKVEFNHDPVSA